MSENPLYYAEPSPIALAPPSDQGGIQVANVKAYGAVGDGRTDDTAAIKAAIAAVAPASAGGPAGTVEFPPGKYLISSTIDVGPYQIAATIPVPYPSLIGMGPPGRIGDSTDESSVEIICSGAFPSGSFALRYRAPNVNVAPTGVRIENIGFKCASLGAGVYLEQPREFFVSRISIDHAQTPTGSPNGATGAFNVVALNTTAPAYNLFQAITVGLPVNDGIVHMISGMDTFLSCWVLNPGRFGINEQGSASHLHPHVEGGLYGFYLYSTVGGAGQIQVIGATYFGTPTSAAIQYVGAAAGHATYVSDSFFASTPGAGPGTEAGAIVDIQAGGGPSHIWFTNCEFNAGANTTQWIYAQATTGTAVFRDCNFTGAPTQGAFTNGGNILRFYNCAGINPRGDLGAIAVGGSPFTYTNNDAVDEMVYVSGGTVTAVTVNGSPTGLTAGGFLVPVGQTIVVTYTVLPTMRKNGL